MPCSWVRNATDELASTAVCKRVATPSAIHVEPMDVIGRVVVRSDPGRYLVIRWCNLRGAGSQYANRR